jgi:O-antigen/teichoic acid export membrane protein
MGIIRKQSIIGTIFTYLGVILGFITTAVLFPKYLTTSQIGLLGLLLSYAMIFAQISSLGFINATTRFFTYFRDREKNHHGFVFLMMAVTTAGFLISLIIYFAVRGFLVESSTSKSALFVDYIDYIIPLTFFTAFFNAMDHFYKVLYNAVIGIVLKEFVQRLFILVVTILFIYAIVSFHRFVDLYVICFALPALIIFFYLLKAGEIHLRPDFQFLNRELVSGMAGVSLFGVVAGATGIFTLNIDRIMIDRILGLSATGIYTTTYFFGTLITMPSRSLTKISAAFIADAWKNDDTASLHRLLFKSCLNQLIIGLLLLVGILGNMDNIYRILPAEFLTGKWVILLVGCGFLTDMAVGVSYVIVANSRLYKYGTYYLLLMVVLVILFNLVLIPLLGITGAAMSFLLTKLIVNLTLMYFVKRRFRMMPYNYKFLMVILFGGIAFLAGWFIPLMTNLYLDILVRSAVITVIFMALIIFFRISEDINERIVYYLKRFMGIDIRL